MFERCSMNLVVTCRLVTQSVLLMLCCCPFGCAANTPSIQTAAKGFAAEVLAEKGAPIVQAIYEYHDAVGLWPRNLDELVSGYVNSSEAQNWRYQWWPNGKWHLTCYLPFSEFAVRYQRDPSGLGCWKRIAGEHETILSGSPPIPTERTSLSKERSERRLEELRRRTRHYRQELSHWRGLVSDSIKAGEFQRARAVVEDCSGVFADDWWPHVVLALILNEMGMPTMAEDCLSSWVARHQSFNNYFFLGWYLLQVGEERKAFETISSGLRHPVSDSSSHPGNVGDEITVGGTWFYWSASTLCYQYRRFDVALAVCDSWERKLMSQHYADRSFSVIRAACYHQLGDYQAAAKQVLLADSFDRASRLSAPDLEFLRRAIDGRDGDYRYLGLDSTRRSTDVWQSRGLSVLVTYE